MTSEAESFNGQLTNLIDEAKILWDEEDIKDTELWRSFREEFSGYKEDDFDHVSKIKLRGLRRYLRKRGVWVQSDDRQSTSIAKALINVLNEEIQTAWIEAEITSFNAEEKFTSNIITHFIETNFGRGQSRNRTPPPGQQKSSPLGQQNSLSLGQRNSPLLEQFQPQQSRSQSINQHPTGQHFQPPIGQQFQLSSGQQYQPPTGQQNQFAPGQQQFQTSPLASHIPATPPTSGARTSHSSALTNVVKLYFDELKYSGDMEDSFSYKLIIFHDICTRVGLHQDRLLALPTMLKGLALDYYYSNISIRGQYALNFDEACRAISTYFEGAEYKRARLDAWNRISLRSIKDKAENLDKSTEECLQLLVKELRHLQHGLDASFRTDAFMHNKLIIACRDVPVCKFVCYKSSETLVGLINDIRSSIVTFSKTHQPETYFIDRYHQTRYFEGRSWSRYSDRPPFDRGKIIEYDSDLEDGLDEYMKTLRIEAPPERKR